MAFVAWRSHGVTRGGAFAAWPVGTAILAGTGWAGGAVLLVFFVGSTAVGRWAEPRTRAVHPQLAFDPKGDTRDPWQVLANGGVAAAAALLELRAPSQGLWLVTISLAAAAADTWATAIGCTSRTLPRSMVTGETVPAGTNGGITVRGSLGAAAGAASVAATGAMASGDLRLLLAGVLLGFSGMLADSLLGAALQGRFRCPACGLESERRVHRCGTPTVPIGGVRWLTNDGVNLLATSLTAFGGWGIWHWLSP